MSAPFEGPAWVWWLGISTGAGMIGWFVGAFVWGVVASCISDWRYARIVRQARAFGRVFGGKVSGPEGL